VHLLCTTQGADAAGEQRRQHRQQTAHHGPHQRARLSAMKLHIAHAAAEGRVLSREVTRASQKAGYKIWVCAHGAHAYIYIQYIYIYIVYTHTVYLLLQKGITIVIIIIINSISMSIGLRVVVVVAAAVVVVMMMMMANKNG
jgi:hypothetical protein